MTHISLKKTGFFFSSKALGLAAITENICQGSREIVGIMEGPDVFFRKKP